MAIKVYSPVLTALKVATVRTAHKEVHAQVKSVDTQIIERLRSCNISLKDEEGYYLYPFLLAVANYAMRKIKSPSDSVGSKYRALYNITLGTLFEESADVKKKAGSVVTAALAADADFYFDGEKKVSFSFADFNEFGKKRAAFYLKYLNGAQAPCLFWPGNSDGFFQNPIINTVAVLIDELLLESKYWDSYKLRGSEIFEMVSYPSDLDEMRVASLSLTADGAFEHLNSLISPIYDIIIDFYENWEITPLFKSKDNFSIDWSIIQSSISPNIIKQKGNPSVLGNPSPHDKILFCRECEIGRAHV